MLRPCHSYRFDHPNNWLGVQILMLLIMQFSPLSCYSVHLRSKYSPQTPSDYVSPSMWATKFHTHTIQQAILQFCISKYLYFWVAKWKKTLGAAYYLIWLKKWWRQRIILNKYIYVSGIVRCIVAVWGVHGRGNKRWTCRKSTAISSEEAIKIPNYYQNYASWEQEQLCQFPCQLFQEMQ